MAEEISVQILSQASENIQKLFDLSTRIDERVKSIKEQQDSLSHQMTSIVKDYHDVTKKLAVLEAHNPSSGISSLSVKFDDTEEQLREIEKRITAVEKDTDKRLTAVESATTTSADRWKQIFGFVIQLVWIIVAAWAIAKLGLQSPPVP